MSAKRKQSLYFSSLRDLNDLRKEAHRIDRPLSWVLQLAWRLARNKIRALEPDAKRLPVVKD